MLATGGGQTIRAPCPCRSLRPAPCRSPTGLRQAACIILLAPGFKYCHGHGIGQIQAALAWAHGQPDTLRRRKDSQVLIRQTRCFPAKDKHISWLELQRRNTARALGCQRKTALRRRACSCQRASQGIMHLHGLPLVVIKPGPPQAGIIEIEAQRAHQVQLRAGIGAQANSITGIRRNFGMDKDDVKHSVILPLPHPLRRTFTPKAQTARPEMPRGKVLQMAS